MESASAVLGRKWHPTIIHHLVEEEPLGFGDLESRIDGISGKVLAESLKDLEEKQLVERRVIDDRPVRVEYSLTPHGRSMESVIEEMVDWGQTYLEEAHSPEESIV
jgi:DNA-binding HxlR family transcriptional regulator